MNREQIMSVLYDIALVIGGEVSVKPLLTRTVQRLLYHTSFPTGLVFLDVPEGDGDSLAVRLDVAVGDFGYAERVGQVLNLPAALLRGGAEVREAPALLAGLTDATRDYKVFLRLPIDHCGVLLMLAPRRPSTQLPLTEIFRPVMANLAKAIMLCRHNDAYAASLVSQRDQAQRALAESEEKFRSMATAAQDAIVMLDDEGRIAYWNPAAERIFGYGADAMGRDAHALIAPERYRQAFQAGFAHFRHSGAGPIVGKAVEIEGLRQDGSEFPVELSVSAMNLRGRWHAVGILRDISERRRAEAAEHAGAERLKRALLGTIQAVALTVEKRDPYTAGHQQKVARLAVAIATELGWPPDQIEGVRLGAMIHDIGKIYVPSEILNRPGRLSELEFGLIKRHPEVGYEILEGVELPWPVARIVLQHHERLDGSGYPHGLTGDAIIPEARLLAVADVVEAITAHRPYRAALGLAAGVAELEAGRGSRFDAGMVDACVRVFRERGFTFDQ